MTEHEIHAGTHPMHRLVGMCKAFELGRFGSLVYACSMLCVILGRSDFNALVPHLQTCTTHLTSLISWQLRCHKCFDVVLYHGKLTVSSMLARTVGQHHSKGIQKQG